MINTSCHVPVNSTVTVAYQSKNSPVAMPHRFDQDKQEYLKQCIGEQLHRRGSGLHHNLLSFQCEMENLKVAIF